MCDNSNSKTKFIIEDNCAPYPNYKIGCKTTDLKELIDNNNNVMDCFKNIKCNIINYINTLSVEFIQNIDNSEVLNERDRLNTLIENLISGIHQSCKLSEENLITPYFQLWIQTETSSAVAAYCSNTEYTNQDDCELNNETWTAYVPAGKTYDLGSGWINQETKSGCYLVSDGSATESTYDECINDSNSVWYGLSTDKTYSEGNQANLYPNKISFLVGCNEGNNIASEEIVYLYIPTLQLLYNPKDSSLDIKIGDVDTKNNPNINSSCLFPLISNEELFRSTVYNIIPPSYNSIGENDDSEVWDSQANIYKFVKNDLLLDNTDLHNLISYLDQVVKKCELANSSLFLKQRIQNYGL